MNGSSLTSFVSEPCNAKDVLKTTTVTANERALRQTIYKVRESKQSLITERDIHENSQESQSEIYFLCIKEKERALNDVVKHKVTLCSCVCVSESVI